MNLNRVVLIGRIASDVEYRELDANNSLARFVIAVNKRNRNTNSGVNEGANFIPAVVWRQNANFVKNFLTKGSLVVIEGHINISRYTSKSTGALVERFEVVGETIENLESRSVSEGRKNSGNRTDRSVTSHGNDTNNRYTSNGSVEHMMHSGSQHVNAAPSKIDNNSFDDVDDFINSIKTEEENEYRNIPYTDNAARLVSENIVNSDREEHIENIIDNIWKIDNE